MKRWCAVTTGVLFVTALFAGSIGLQAATKTATGTVSSVTADSLTIKTKDAKAAEMKFSVDMKTTVIGKGAGTKNAKMKEDKKSPHLTDFIKSGDEVTVKYDDAKNVASEIRLAQPVTK